MNVKFWRRYLQRKIFIIKAKNELMLIVKDDVYKYRTYKRLMIKAKMDK